MKALLTEKNIAALKETFDLKVFDWMDSFNHIIKLPHRTAKEICTRFDDFEYKDKRTFARNLCNLASLYIQTHNEEKK